MPHKIIIRRCVWCKPHILGIEIEESESYKMIYTDTLCEEAKTAFTAGVKNEMIREYSDPVKRIVLNQNKLQVIEAAAKYIPRLIMFPVYDRVPGNTGIVLVCEGKNSVNGVTWIVIEKGADDE